MSFKILATSDVHGYLEPYHYATNEPQDLGLAKIKTLFTQLKDENTILLDNGDIIQGNPLTYYWQKNDFDQVPYLTMMMNQIGYDYINLGNHDFNFGMDVLKNHLANLKAKCVTCNVLYQNKPLGKSEIVTLSNGLSIGIVGVVTHYITHWESKESLQDVVVEDAYTCLKREVSLLKKENIDYIIGLYHGGFEKDLLSGKPTEKQTTENQGYQMCQDITDLTCLITGHQHRSIATTLNNILVSQTANNGQEVAYYQISEKEKNVSLLPARYPADQAMLQDFAATEAKIQQWLDQPLISMDNDLLVTDQFKARLHKHPIVSFLNTVQLTATNAQLSGVALFNEAKGFKKVITVRDVVSTYVYDNSLVKVKITGAQLCRYLEQCANYFALKDQEIVVNPEYSLPKPQHYNYDLIDNIDYTIKVSNALNHKIISLKYQGKDIQADDVFTLVISDYRANGGGNFSVFNEVLVLQTYTKSMVDYIIEYLQTNPQPLFINQNNIQVIK